MSPESTHSAILVCLRRTITPTGLKALGGEEWETDPLRSKSSLLLHLSRKWSLQLGSSAETNVVTGRLKAHTDLRESQVLLAPTP